MLIRLVKFYVNIYYFYFSLNKILSIRQFYEKKNKSLFYIKSLYEYNLFLHK